MAEPASRDDPLSAWHRGRGAHLATRDAGDDDKAAWAVRHYGDVAGEYRALVGGAALFHDRERGLLEVRGEDRLRFLANLTTRELRGIGPEQGAYTFFTDVRGRVLADGLLLLLADAALVELGRASGPVALESHLRKYLVADRVELEQRHGLVALVLAGEKVDEAVTAVVPAEPWGHRLVTLGGVEVRIARDEHRGTPAWTVWAPDAAAPGIVEELVSRCGLHPVGEEAMDRVRVEAAVPRFGVDFGPENLPQETGLEAEAVSYDKGCYLGQEIVARLHYRGQPARRMCRLLIDGERVPTPGPLLYEGREAGRLTSAVDSPRHGRPVGLGVLQRRVEAGSWVEAADGIGAMVEELAPVVGDVPRETSSR